MLGLSGRNTLTLLRLHLVALFVAGVLVLLVVGGATMLVQDKSDKADRNAQAALLAADAEGKVSQILAILDASSQSFLDSSLVQLLTPGQQGALRKDLTRTDAGDPSPDLPDVLVPLSLNEATTMQSSLDLLSTSFNALQGSFSAADQALAAPLVTAGGPLVQNYFNYPTPTNLRLLKTHFNNVESLLAGRVPALSSTAHQQQNDLQHTASLARAASFATVVVLGLFLLTLAAYMSRRIRASIAEVESEREQLEETSHSLQYRNDQLNALYRVFSEITESLSMPYVVRATVVETQKVMNSSGVVLRLLQGDHLVAVGAVDERGEDIQGIPPAQLGEGPTGRAARRGRTQRIDEDAQTQLGPAPGGASVHLESGMIVPLIVGARVVGTLSCWSFKKRAFNDEDERIMEMMASQAATAIVAAETTDTSTRRALHDPLTGLPNRRQLDQDLNTVLANLEVQGRKAVVAMVDIDHFKHFNDEFGHRVGDVTLQQVASVMSNSVREGDHVYRYGGEEFVIVLPDVGPVEGMALANRLRSAIESTPFSGDQLQPVGPVTVSIGLALLPQHGSDIGTLIELADHAMYRAKDLGRNRVCLWQSDEVDVVDEATEDAKTAA